MERHFDDELKGLKQRLIQMAARAEESVALSMKTLTERRDEISQGVFDLEQKVNTDEMEIEAEMLSEPQSDRAYVCFFCG